MKDLSKMSLAELREHERRVGVALQEKLSEAAQEYSNEQAELMAQLEEYAGHQGWSPAVPDSLGGVDRFEMGRPSEGRLVVQFWPFEDDRDSDPHRQAVTVTEVDTRVVATFNENPPPPVLVGLVDAWWREMRGL